jgi:hypothetical protein
MNNLESLVGWFNSKHQFIILIDEKDKMIAFEKGDLLFFKISILAKV